MLTPSYLRHAPEMAEEIAEELHTDLMNRIVARILHRFRRGDDYILTAQDKFQLETLQEAGFLMEDLQREIARRTGRMQSEIAEAMEDAGVRTLEYDDSIYRSAGYAPAPLVQSPYLVQLMERSYRATVGEWTNFTRTTAEAAQQTFIRACDTAYHLSMTGAVSPTQAVREALQEVIRDGVYVQYPTGHRDTIETATARAVRTGISQASAQIQLARMDEFGVGLVLVSSHLGARPEHQVWQGKVYDRSGQHPAYPDFIRSTGYGRVDGLCGANCRHHFSPYFEGQHNPFTQYDSEENQKQYDIEQRQRTMERRIRDTKRQTMNWKTAMDKETDPAKQAEFAAEYQRKAALLKKQNAAYREYCAATGQKLRPERLEIARWDRSQAAKAAAVARKPLTQNVKTVTIKGNTLHTTSTEVKKVTAQSMQKIKPFSCATLTVPSQRKLSNEHKRMLMGVFSKKSDVIEAGRAYRLNMTPLCEMQYSVPGVASVQLPDFDEPYILIHSHPDGRTFSPQDIVAFLKRSNLKMLTAVGNDGAVYAVEKTGAYNPDELWMLMRKMLVDVLDILKLNKSDSERADMIADRMIPFFEEAKKHGIAYFSTRN